MFLKATSIWLILQPFFADSKIILLWLTLLRNSISNSLFAFKLSKEKFIEQLFQWKNDSFMWCSNEEMSKIVNMNYVCFVDIEEFTD